MRFLKTSIAAGFAIVAIAAVAQIASAAHTRGHPAEASPVARAARSCGTVRGRGERWRVHAPRRVRCHGARRVLRAFLHGKGRMHGPTNGPAYKQYWTLYGWRCGNAAGAVGCSRHRRSIYATAIF